ncbi:MAG: response regulator transcription factor [Armatimonadetes bacterium]|nr:response regulator transcription factor [Armatimonadota bacterium]
MNAFSFGGLLLTLNSIKQDLTHSVSGVSGSVKSCQMRVKICKERGAGMQTERILLVDDDAELMDLIAEYLEMEGFDIALAEDGMKGLQRASTEEFAIVILDVMMPGLNGFEVLKRLRAVSQVPVLMLTAKGDDIDRIIGLEIGADDYMAKPCNPRELVARIRAVLRRVRPLEQGGSASKESSKDRLILGDVALDMAARTVRRGDEYLTLTSVEFEVLVALLRNAGKVLTREVLAQEAMGRELLPFERGIDMHISNVRKKLGAHPDGLERVKSIRSVGYIYTRPTEGR